MPRRGYRPDAKPGPPSPERVWSGTPAALPERVWSGPGRLARAGPDAHPGPLARASISVNSSGCSAGRICSRFRHGSRQTPALGGSVNSSGYWASQHCSRFGRPDRRAGPGASLRPHRRSEHFREQFGLSRGPDLFTVPAKSPALGDSANSSGYWASQTVQGSGRANRPARPTVRPGPAPDNPPRPGARQSAPARRRPSGLSPAPGPRPGQKNRRLSSRRRRRPPTRGCGPGARPPAC